MPAGLRSRWFCVKELSGGNSEERGRKRVGGGARKWESGGEERHPE